MASDIYTQSGFLVLKAAHMYYTLHMSQQKIADELNVSVTTVSRLIKKAKEKKIVRYIVDDSCAACISLARQLELCMGIQEVIIAPSVFHPGESLSLSQKRRIVSLEAARYLQRTIKPNDVLGISWGRIVCDMLLYLNPSHKVDTTFVTLHGKLGPCIEQELTDLVRGMARAFSGNNYYLPFDALAATPEQAKMIRQSPVAKKVYQVFDHINISITGVGTWYPEPKSILGLGGFLSQQDQQELLNNNVVGDIGLRFFDIHGEECNTGLSDRLIAIDFEQFRKIDLKITVAAGLEKAHTVMSAVRGKLIDVLILDQELALALLDMYTKIN